jgi:RHS repeat-associated protein
MRLYVTQDANFNVTALVDTSGTVQERFTYEPYGNANILDQDWNGTSDAYDWTYFHQCGAFDLDTVIYAFRNRDYHPSLGRWMERDTWDYADGMNLYQYLGSSPITFVDPFGNKGGRNGTGIGATIGGILGGLIGGAVGGLAGTAAEPGGAR